jgi:hypothetical protein
MVSSSPLNKILHPNPHYHQALFSLGKQNQAEPLSNPYRTLKASGLNESWEGAWKAARPLGEAARQLREAE